MPLPVRDEAAGGAKAGRRLEAGGWSVAHRPLHVADVDQADLAHVDGREGVGDERVEAVLAEMDVEDGAATGGDGHRLRAGQHVVGSPSVQARSSRVPTTWKAVSNDGPAATTKKRTFSPILAGSGCVLYCAA